MSMKSTTSARSRTWAVGPIVAILLVAAALVPATSAADEVSVVTKYAYGGAPVGITSGPDGALWFTRYGPRSVGRITTTGDVREHAIPQVSGQGMVGGITSGSDGALWLTDCDAIWRVATDGTMARIVLPYGVCAHQLTKGPDGAVWFTASTRAPTDYRNWAPGRVGRISPAGEVHLFPTRPGFLHPSSITTGPDGALWFAESGYNASEQLDSAIVRMTTEGSETRYPVEPASCPQGITTGPDGAMWFSLVCRGVMVRLTTAGSMTEFPVSEPRRSAYGTAFGRDGAMWYVLNNGNIGRMTTAGTTSVIPTGDTMGGGGNTGIVAGPDGAVWFTGFSGMSSPGPGPMPGPGGEPMPGPETWSGPMGYIGRVSVPAAPAPPPDTTPATAEIASPKDGDSYTLMQKVPAQFSCSDPSGVAQCVGSVADGTLIDTSAAGAHTFKVTTLDKAGNSGTVTVSYTVLAGNASEEVTGGDTVTTDPGNMGATPEVPLQTSIKAPAGVTGTISVTPTDEPAAPQNGYSLFGEDLVLSGPEATAAAPYTVTFTVDATALDGIAPADVQVFRNGTALTGCTHPTAAVPDPCIANRGFAPGGEGDAIVTVRTSKFSTWSLGRLSYQLTGPFQPVEAAPTVNTAKAGSAIPVKFKLGGAKGLDVFAAGFPGARTASCSAATDEVEEQLETQASSALSYDSVNGQYTYLWKTVKTDTGCRELVLRFRDGSELRAVFNLR